MNLWRLLAIFLFKVVLGQDPSDLPQLYYEPPGSNTEIIESFFDGPSEACKVGLYQDGFRAKNGAFWEGYPLGKWDGGDRPSNYPNPYLDNKCVNLRDLDLDLQEQLSSYTVIGWCECEFFAKDDCLSESSRFAAFNRQDREMWNNGSDDDTIRSMKCQYTQEAIKQRTKTDPFLSCTVIFVANDITFDHSRSATAPKRINFRELDKCFTVPKGDLTIGKYIINGCSCKFWKNLDCSGSEVDYAGNAGRTTMDCGTQGRPFEGLPLFGSQDISYKCFLPTGIAWEERLDKQDPYGFGPHDRYLEGIKGEAKCS
ncbi:hypothetical protein H072_9592 [Dactylellina haptotyla CBS 200.50]|uniref:Cyanovirin-N domain-containing protein n=1 Tax=Dactylellina haptotyla (strain CBS 200.50) TaxID=1284197 RepID=S8A1J1_DACHA|nr:hypothetical protein H072_9592 [Dactylellina haptotyla CBS 200.50]